MTLNYYPQFFTATILEWKQLLVLDSMKQIIISSLQYLVNEGPGKNIWICIDAKSYSSIMAIQDGHEKVKVRQSFLKYTAQHIKFALAQNIKELEKYKVKASDRAYQFWERNSLGIDLWSRPVFIQKLNYMHNNPIQPHWKLCQYPEEYKYSSSRFYDKGVDEFGFLTHYLR